MPNNEILAAAVAPVANRFAEEVTVTMTAPPTWYAVNKSAAAPDEAEVTIYDAIGGFGVSADKFVGDLKKITAKQINVRINTPGGEVFAATAIHNALKEHPARIVTHVDGVAASAGSFVALAGDEVRMADNAYLMIHNARGGMMGGADEMRSYATSLEKINENIAGMYARKSGKSAEHFAELMAAETWFTADEAKAEGLVDTVYTPAKKKQPYRASADFDFTIYNKIPDPVRRMWNLPQIQTAPIVSPGGEQAPAIPTQEQSMTDPIAAAPAPSAVAPSVPVPPAAQAAPDVDTLAGLRQITAQQYVQQGVSSGRLIERQSQQDLLRELVSACPGKPELAINAFLSAQSPATVKLAFDAAKEAEKQADARIAAMELKHAREMALSATGGHAGVPMGATGNRDAEIAFAPDTPPETQAKMEWAANMAADGTRPRDSGATENQWMLARVQQLNGNIRAYKRTA